MLACSFVELTIETGRPPSTFRNAVTVRNKCLLKKSLGNLDSSSSLSPDLDFTSLVNSMFDTRERHFQRCLLLTNSMPTITTPWQTPSAIVSTKYTTTQHYTPFHVFSWQRRNYAINRDFNASVFVTVYRQRRVSSQLRLETIFSESRKHCRPLSLSTPSLQTWASTWTTCSIPRRIRRCK